MEWGWLIVELAVLGFAVRELLWLRRDARRTKQADERQDPPA
jgi:hypothetical protein